MSNQPNIIALEDPEFGIIYLEINEEAMKSVADSEDWTNINNEKDGIVEKIQGRMGEALESIHTLGKSALKTWKDLNLDEVELKTCLKFTMSEGKLIGWLAQAGGEFAVEVTLKWKFNS